MVAAKIETISKLPMEGILLDRYNKDDGVCPFEIDPTFNLTQIQASLTALDMKMYLGIKASIPIGQNCSAETIVKKIDGCLLTKNGSKTDFEIGLMKKLDSNGL